MYCKAVLVAFAAFFGSCHGQMTLLGRCEISWSTDFLPMGQGNGIVVSPDGTCLYATASDGTVGAMDMSGGSVEWTYKPMTGYTYLEGGSLRMEAFLPMA